MANVRDIKKDIHFVVNELVVECFTYNYLFSDRNQEELASIIAETLEMGNHLTDMVNRVKGTKENPAKKQFKAIHDELNEKVEVLIDRIEKIAVV